MRVMLKRDFFDREGVHHQTRNNPIEFSDDYVTFESLKGKDPKEDQKVLPPGAEILPEPTKQVVDAVRAELKRDAEIAKQLDDGLSDEEVLKLASAGNADTKRIDDSAIRPSHDAVVQDAAKIVGNSAPSGQTAPQSDVKPAVKGK